MSRLHQTRVTQRNQPDLVRGRIVPACHIPSTAVDIAVIPVAKHSTGLLFIWGEGHAPAPGSETQYVCVNHGRASPSRCGWGPASQKRTGGSTTIAGEQCKDRLHRSILNTHVQIIRLHPANAPRGILNFQAVYPLQNPTSSSHFCRELVGFGATDG